MANTSDQLLDKIKSREGESPEFLQAVNEVLETLAPVFAENPKYLKCFEVLAEPDRGIQFRVPWEDDKGEMQVNRGFRVQFSSVIGPYKGGLRLHPSVNLSVIKFLGFEQCFKNALTGLPIGGAKGGADFDPKGKSDNEIRRFCQSFINELYRHIGPDTDVPAGDIGVGGREIGYMFGHYKKLANISAGVFTGKAPSWGGSLIRPEATGYGVVYFVEALLKSQGTTYKDKKCLVSGSGNVAVFCIEKIIALGGTALTACDSSGTVYDPEGFTTEKLAAMRELKEVKRGRISELIPSLSKSAKFFAGKKPWELGIDADVAFPCATQNELDENDAKELAKHGVKIVGEGANMPTTHGGAKEMKSSGMILCPGKAANAGGVAVSALEMSQNSMRLSWTREEVDKKLNDIMVNIFNTCMTYGEKYGSGPNDLVTGANTASFIKLSQGLMAFGLV